MCKKTCSTAAALAACQRDLADRDAALGVATTSANEWKALADERAGAMADMRTEVASLKTDLNKMRGYRDAGLRDVARLNDRVIELERLAASRLEQLEAREAAHTSDHIELVARRDECVKLNDRVVELEGQLAEQGERLGDVSELAASRLEEIGGLFKELTEQRNLVSCFQKAAQGQQQEKIAMRDQRDLARRCCDEKDRELVELRRIVANSNDATALVDASREIERLEAVIDGLTGERGRLSSELVDLRRQLDDKAADLGSGLEKPVRALVKAVRAILLNLPMSNGSIGLIEALAVTESALPKEEAPKPAARVVNPVPDHRHAVRVNDDW